MFESVGLGYFRKTLFESFLGDMRRDDSIEGLFEAGEATEDLEVLFRREVMGLISIGDEVRDENLLGP